MERYEDKMMRPGGCPPSARDPKTTGEAGRKLREAEIKKQEDVQKRKAKKEGGE